MENIVKTDNRIVKLKRFLQEKVGGRKDFASFIKSNLLDIGCNIENIGDIGCGAGTVAMELARILPESNVYGLDVNDHFGLNQNKPDNFQYVNFEPYNLSLKDMKFDAVVLGGVLHHIPKKNIGKFFDDMNKCISESGIVIVHEHRLSDLNVRKYIEKIQLDILETLNTKTLEGMLCGYNFYTKSNLTDTFRNYGYELIKSYDTNGKFVTLPTINGNTVFIFRKKDNSSL